MNTLLWPSLYALLASLAPLLLLALRDPKRLRAQGLARAAAHSRRARALLGVLALLPGLLLLAWRDWHGLLIWGGALPCLGWALTMWLSAARHTLR